MAQNRVIRVGPVALTTTLTTNIFNCGVTSLAGPIGITLTQPYVIFNLVHVINKTGLTATFSLWIGATGANAAGTEIYSGVSVPANGFIDAGHRLYMKDTDFLVGGAGTATALTLTLEGEIGFQQ